MGVRLRHKGDDPDEIWLECGECEGAGWVNVPHEESWLAGDESVYVQATCPDCDGSGFYAGEPDDVDETRWTD